MKSLAAGLVAVGAMNLSAVSLAQVDSAPTTAPSAATAPTVVVEVPVDDTTPRGALKIVVKAMGEGDVQAAQSVLVSDNELQKSWAGVMLKLAVAQNTVFNAAKAKFGDEGAKTIVGDVASARVFAMAAIDRSSEELQGDKATVRSADGVEAPIELRKVDGKWRVPVTAFVGDATEQQLTETAEKMSKQADAIVAFSAQIGEGKFATPEDAAQGLMQAQVKAVYGDKAPATAPTTAPANPPG